MTTVEILRSRLENKPGVVGASIITRSGAYFDFLNPDPATILPEDIAWALAHTCRFGGHSTAFYSVAQHCVLVSRAVPAEDAFAALMHDAPEAYVGDVVGPLKQLIPDYKAVERHVEAAVFARFGVALPLPPTVKHADLRLLRTEQRDLTTGAGHSWNGLDKYPPLTERITPLLPADAAELWLSRFRELAPATASAPDGSPLATKARTAPDALPHSPLDRDGLVERLRDKEFPRAGEFDPKAVWRTRPVALFEEAADRLEAAERRVGELTAPGGWRVLMERDARRLIGDPFQGVGGSAVGEFVVPRAALSASGGKSDE